MDRERAIEILWPLDQPRKHTIEVEEALRFLEEDEAVRAYFERDAALGRRLQRTDISEDAPPELRARILAALAEDLNADSWSEATLLAGTSSDHDDSAEPVIDSRFAPGSTFGRPGWRHALAAAAAIVLLAIGSTLSSLVGGRFALDDNEFVADFVRTASAQPVTPGRSSLSDGSVSSFYVRELGVPIRPVSVEDGEMTRAVVCVIEGERGSMIEYDMDGTRLAHYRIPARQGRLDPVDLKVTDEGGYKVARWRDGEFTHALVADVSSREMRDLAIDVFKSSEY
jgi:anti-sigma factor RsiW